MTASAVTYAGGQIFDGEALHEGKAARFQDGMFAGLIAAGDMAKDETVIDLEGGILSPGYVDLQVNGGGGIILNNDPSLNALKTVAKAHRSLGAVSILPTLITDRPETTRMLIDAVKTALRDGVPGIAGLHLEGPHLSVARKGAHDGAMIRPMGDDDMRLVLEAKADIPVLKVTLAPENVTVEQTAQLVEAGVLVSLGHTDADFETCRRYVKAGASCVTHLFNAMSQLTNREPGLVGAALASGEVSAGLIADAIHVHPATMRAAWMAKTGPGRIFLVSDAMAVAGTDETEFFLDGRKIGREGGRLTLEDGTLAGADLELTRALDVLVNKVGIELPEALRAATTTPAELIGLNAGLRPGITPMSDVILIAEGLDKVMPLT